VTVKKIVTTGFEVATTKLPLYGGLTGVRYLDTLHYQISWKRLTLIDEIQKHNRFGLKRNLLFKIVPGLMAKHLY